MDRFSGNTGACNGLHHNAANSTVHGHDAAMRPRSTTLRSRLLRAATALPMAEAAVPKHAIFSSRWSLRASQGVLSDLVHLVERLSPEQGISFPGLELDSHGWCSCDRSRQGNITSEHINQGHGSLRQGHHQRCGMQVMGLPSANEGGAIGHAVKVMESSPTAHAIQGGFSEA
jgi:hypothetical protein